MYFKYDQYVENVKKKVLKLSGKVQNKSSW